MIKPFNVLLKTLVPATLCIGLAISASAEVLNTDGTGSGSADATSAGTSEVDPTAGASFSQITRIYDSWSLQCRERSGEGKCFVETVVRQSKPQVRDVIVLRFGLDGDGVETTVVTPNRVKLDRGVVLTIGDESFTGNYVICGPTNCNASLPSEADLADILRAQTELTVSFFVFAPADQGGEREVKIPVNLSGFSQALDHLVVFDAEQ